MIFIYTASFSGLNNSEVYKTLPAYFQMSKPKYEAPTFLVRHRTISYAQDTRETKTKTSPSSTQKCTVQS